jgi:hypothetical protein
MLVMLGLQLQIDVDIDVAGRRFGPALLLMHRFNSN